MDDGSGTDPVPGPPNHRKPGPAPPHAASEGRGFKQVEMFRHPNHNVDNYGSQSENKGQLSRRKKHGDEKVSGIQTLDIPYPCSAANVPAQNN
jgi:hypothetical protein